MIVTFFFNVLAKFNLLRLNFKGNQLFHKLQLKANRVHDKNKNSNNTNGYNNSERIIVN